VGRIRIAEHAGAAVGADIFCIVAAQAVTVVAAPLAAGALLLLTSSKKIMGDYRNGPVINLFAGIGFVLLLGMAWYIATEKVIPQINSMRSESAAVEIIPQPEMNLVLQKLS